MNVNVKAWLSLLALTVVMGLLLFLPAGTIRYWQAWLYLIFLVYRENTYTSATIEVAEGQKVVDTGPYAVVRHPMYAGGLLYLGGTPLALGSYRGLLAFAVIVSLIIWRLLDEEQFLARELPGYRECR